MMATVHLHGYLGERYGRRFELAASSVAEALRLLRANFSGFTSDILKHSPGFVVKVDGKAVKDACKLSEHHLNPEIHIVPAIKGAGGKSGGAALIIAAAVIAIAAYTGYIPADYAGAAYNVSLNLAISGVSQLMFSSTSVSTDSPEELTGETNKASYAFNGPVNTTAQGNPVPVLYGRLRVGSQVVSAGIFTG